MAEPQKYISELTGEQLDAAFRQMAVIDQSVSQAAASAAQAAGSASQSAQAADRAAESASAAGQSAGDAESSAAAAASSAVGASGSEDAAAESARQAAASAASIAGGVEQAAASANAASQSATQAASSASAAAASASAAADSEDKVQANAAAAQQAAASASESEGNAKASETAAASSAQTATGAASAAQTSETNAAESARQAAASVASIGDDVATSAANAQAAQQAASDASASAAAAEDAATRAEQIADFDPSDFATAAQGTKADTAVQSVNGKTGTAITLAAADVGAATAAQGSLAETAVQPDALDAYALKTDVPDTPADIGAATAAQGAKADTAVQSINGAKPDSSGNVQLDLTTGTVRSVNGKDPDGSGNVQLSAGDVGAATAAQGALAATAVQPADLDDYAKAGDIPKKLPNPQALGIRLGSGGSVTAYDGSVSRTVTITPEAIGAQPAGAASGGEVTLIADTGLTSWSQAASYNSVPLATGGYDMVGIVCLCNSSTASDEYSPIQWFPIPAPGQSRKYGLFCMDVNNSPMGEAQVRMISITNNGSTIQIRSDTPGYYYNWSNRGQENRCAVPAFIYGIKF